MPWIIGGVSSLSWSAARDKVRGDLWRKGTTAIPDDVVDRALHASILDIESRRKWQWLESVTSSIELDADANQLNLPACCGGFSRSPSSSGRTLGPTARAHSHSDEAAADGRRQSRLSQPLRAQQRHRVLRLHRAGRNAFELIFQAKCPDLLEDAVESPPVTLGLHQQAVLAGAKALVALEYLHDDDKAAATARLSRSTSAAWRTATTSCAATTRRDDPTEHRPL
jgi:hypothetical protein